MGETSKPHLLTLSIFLLALVVLPSMMSQVSAQCKGDLPGLMEKCPKYVSKTGRKVAPSKECCDVVKTCDVACVCKYITKEIEKLISMEKVVFVAKKCGKKITRGTKCGSYTVP